MIMKLYFFLSWLLIMKCILSWLLIMKCILSWLMIMNCISFYPDCLKLSEVIPIYKSGEQNICSHYRPVSILLQFNKMFERILYERVYFYLQEYELLSKYPFGFRPRSSTSYAFESVYSDLLSNADNELYSCSIILDLSKPFNTVNHNVLFNKVYYNFGIRGIPLQLFRSYLSIRKPFGKLEHVQSGLVDIWNDVPQGSVLGPLLFIMYIIDLQKSSAFYTVPYADDTYLCLSH